MNFEMLKGLIERAAYMLGMWALASGWIPKELVQEFVGLIVTAASLGWGWWVNRQVNLVKTTAALPEVKSVTVKDGLDASELTGPDAKVTQG